MKYYICIFLMLYSFFLNGQSNEEMAVDSILVIQPDKLDSLYYSFFLKYRINNLDLAEKYALKAHESALKENHDVYLEKSANALGYVYNNRLDFNKSLTYYSEALSIAEKNNQENRIMYLYNNIGNVYLNASQFDRAIDNYLNSLNFAIKLEKFADQSIAHSNIGLLYYKLGNYEVAIDHLRKALEIKNEHQISEGKKETYINLGLCYNALGNYSDAINSFNNVLNELSEEDEALLLDVYFGIGKTYFNNKNYESAIQSFNQAKTIAEKIDKQREVSSIDYYLAYIFFNQGNRKIALDFLNNSQMLAEKINAWDRLKNNYELYTKIYDENHDYVNAYKSLKSFVFYKDSIFNEELSENFKDAYVRFEQSFSNDIIRGQEVKLKKNKQFSYTLSLSLIFAIVISVFAYRTAYYRRKLNKQLDALVKIKTKELITANDKLVKSQGDLNTFLYKTSHDLRGPIATLMGLTNLSRFEKPSTEIISYLDKIGQTTDHLNNVISSLTTVSHISTQEIKLEKVFIVGILNELLTASELKYTKKIHVRFKGKIPDFIITDKILFEYILKNLIDNAYKFNNPSKWDSYIEVSVQLKDNIDIVIKDDGVGIPLNMVSKIFDLFVVANDLERGLGLGLYQASLAAERLNGSIKLAKHKSPTIFVVTLPRHKQV